jgi:hypothetical protein
MLERVWGQTGKLAAVDKEDAKRGASFSVDPILRVDVWRRKVLVVRFA